MTSASAADIAKAAKAAFTASQLVDPTERNLALQILQEELEKLKPEILAANKQDLEVSAARNKQRKH